MTGSVLYYFHDPMCSWCWGYRPTWLMLQEQLPDDLSVQYVLGGLAADTNDPMPRHMQKAIQGYWKRIEKELGAQFNFEFWEKCNPRRSTYNACRAVIAATNQQAEKEMIYAIQQAYYLRAMNPSDNDTLQLLAKELSLDVKRFSDDLGAPQTESALQAQIGLARSAPISGFPSLVLEVDKRLAPVVLDYKDYRVSLSHILDLLNKSA